MKKLNLIFFSITILFLTFSSVTLSEEKWIEGKAVVVDGDTIKIDGIKIRLFGIDAPEMNQICNDKNNHAYNCGKSSKFFLETITKSKLVSCSYESLDKYGRVLGVCGLINGLMVISGNAVAYLRYSDKYLIEHELAKANKKGIWAGEFDMPEEWRKKYK
tara:strand:- start:21 stop:500 length:480 start_codon:yes stop_codon:yes gene_type:complete